MGKAGRKRKAGARYPSGGLRPAYDKGSERVASMRERYGTHYGTALGRAYAGGLLGPEEQALDRYQAGKRFVRVYERMIGGVAYRCPLDRTPAGSNIIDLDSLDHDRRDHDWLHTMMTRLDHAGLRPWLDQLITVLHVDAGPAWLDRLLSGGRDPADRMVMDAAIRALDVLAPPRRPIGIVTLDNSPPI